MKNGNQSFTMGSPADDPSYPDSLYDMYDSVYSYGYNSDLDGDYFYLLPEEVAASGIRTYLSPVLLVVGVLGNTLCGVVFLMLGLKVSEIPG